MKQENFNKDYLPALTGLRAVSAFMVYFHHFNPIKNRDNNSLLYDFFSEMHIGVTFFFFLSGFLIAYRYYDRSFQFKTYFINRFSRIYPLYFILTTVNFILAGFNFKNLVLYFLNISFLKGFFEQFKFTGIGQGWSLTVEEMFYFSAPFFFILIKKNKLNIYILPIIIFLVGIGLTKIFQEHSFYGLMGSFNFLMDFTFFGRCFEFFSGIFLAIFLKKNIKVKLKYFTLLSVISLVLLLLALVYLKPNENSYGTDVLLGKIINNLVIPVFGLIPLFYGLVTEKTKLSILLETKMFQMLGKSSYAFYLIHLGFMQLCLTQYFNYFGLFVMLNIIAILLYYVIEKPINNYLKKMLVD